MLDPAEGRGRTGILLSGLSTVDGKQICLALIVLCGVLATIFDSSEDMLPQPWAIISSVRLLI